MKLFHFEFRFLNSTLNKIPALLLTAFWLGSAGVAKSQDLAQQNELFWHTNTSQGITWDIREEKRLPHEDNIELSGSLVSGIVRYKVDQSKQVQIFRDVIFPQLRKYSKSSESMYRAYLREEYSDNILPVITLADKKLEAGILDSVTINGKISFHFRQKDDIQIVRSFFPSMDKRCFVEKWTLKNTGSTTQRLKIGATELNQEEAGWHGQYHRRVSTDAKADVSLEPGHSYEFGIYFTATMNAEAEPKKSFSEIEHQRDLFLDSISHQLVLNSPDKVINTLFYFSKIRAAESIFQSRLGLVHSPGGGNYYVGIWANDQAEYSGPFFSYLGYQTGMQAAMNAYRIFQKNIPKDGGKMWASFELDVTFPFGAHDRGDAAMIAYGATHFLLASGDKTRAEEIWPLIDWCLQYTHKRVTADGIVASESDELEGRFPTGAANLSTSSLYYGALVQAARLAKAMGKPAALSADYTLRAKKLSEAIEKYFGAKMEGLDTYKYYKENTTLRSWICLPLVVGLNVRKNGTLDALFGKLWSDNGVLTELKKDQNGEKVFWDRGTLYAFRGAFKAGAADRALERLASYSTTRLTGFRAPYVVEAWPENGMAHLSAESALYCRIFTEGVLGLEPTSFNSFQLRPNLPEKWDHLSMKNIRAFNTTIDIQLERHKEKLRLRVFRNGQIIVDKIVNNNTEVAVGVGH
ncbi:MAG: six-hairpin glycosidase-like protein [Bacteroidota bacterium]